MKAPVCRLCGAAHWNHEPHETGGVEVRAEVERFFEAKGRVVPVVERPRQVEAVEASLPCQECGVMVAQGKSGSPRKYCSSRCRTRAHRARGAE